MALSEAQEAEIRGILQAERNRILENAQRALGLTMNRDRDAIGRDSMDESVEEWMYGTELRLQDRESFLLTKINAALARLDAGEIDECEDCSEEIGYKRLRARPVTTLCILCKEDREQQEGP
jgi:DnaK suppressor protein